MAMTVPQRNAQEPISPQKSKDFEKCGQSASNFDVYLRHNLMTDGDRMK